MIGINYRGKRELTERAYFKNPIQKRIETFAPHHYR